MRHREVGVGDAQRRDAGSTARRLPASLTGLFVLALACGCARAPAPKLATLLLDSYQGEDVLGLQEAEVRARAEEQLAAAGFVRLRTGEEAGKAGAWRAALALDVAEPEDLRASVTGILELKAIGSEPRGFDVQRRAEVTAASVRVDDVQDAARRALGRLLDELGREARALVELDGRPSDELQKALASPSAERSRAALALLAQRRHPAALAPLLERLGEEDPLDLRRTVGLLVALGDERSVGPLIDSSRAKSPVYQREIVFAVGALGGEEAEAYLDAVSRGHDDELLRGSAEQALEELRRRRTTDKGGRR